MLLFTMRSIPTSSCAILATIASAALAAAAPSPTPQCRYVPEDPQWPSVKDWNELNRTVGGSLIRGVPLAHSCYGPGANEVQCSNFQNTWMDIAPAINDPVNIVSAYFDNNTCNPFFGPLSAEPAQRNATCTLGNLAEYAINVTDANSVIAGIRFARKKNIRLTVKNTGHDFLGRSTGRGALALWTHNLKEATFFRYHGKYYTGPAARIGAGVEVREMYEAAAARGLRVAGGSCPSVGAAGGWTQGGGHGPLTAAYGLGADQTLEFDVVTPDGRRVTASRTQHSDLYFALSGGGPGNYGVVLSVTVKAHEDGPVAGSRLVWAHDNDDVFWQAVEAWIRLLQVIDTIPGFRTVVQITKGRFQLNMATLPDGTESQLTQTLQPFYHTLAQLNITPLINVTTTHDRFAEHYIYYNGDDVYTRNLTVGSWLVPRAFVRNETNLPQLTTVMRGILEHPGSLVVLLSNNVTHARAGTTPGTNAVTQAWRNSLFLVNLALSGEPMAPWPELSGYLATVNNWQDRLRAVVPDSGAYLNEATYNNPNWRQDYFGETYSALRRIKAKYDPGHVLWNEPAVGSDALVLRGDGRLCTA
ncbi:hypothetical protein B0I37DRAFT_407895 [Chaetomium sp. MPI-CAGE-AT-0009]|nr:hypothetical protein B0I37DRAFT_407895 [Chaetomium sp. MPI-CAGE-AT-0009]